jgi:two-component system, OmpR family, sensor histidine kinase VicK
LLLDLNISYTSSNIEFYVTPEGEKTEISYGHSNVLDREIQFISNAKLTIDTCMDYTRTLLTVGIEPIKKILLDAKNRNVKLRYITKITTENISYCKELMKFTELRHLDGSLNNFMVSDEEYLASGGSQGMSDLESQIIYSNVKEIVERQKYIFNTLWNKAIPVIKRIREIEEEQTSITEVLYGTENAVARGIQFMKNVKERMDICFDNKAPSIVVEIDIYRNGYEDIRKNGGKIRAFTEITNDNIHHIKELLKIVDELRHLDGMKGGIAVSETECMATTILHEAKPLTQVIYSNNKAFVEQMQYIFDVFWYKAIPARQRLREIEEGIKREFIETIQDPADIKTLVFKL